MKYKRKDQSQWIQNLNALREVPERDPQKAQAARVHFLQQAQKAAAGVTQKEKERHSTWNTQTPIRKERFSMATTLASILVVISLIFGGGGLTLASAQDSQPSQPLYAFKLWLEDIHMNFAPDPEAKFEAAVRFANRRAEEMQKMLEAGEVPPEAVQTRYQNHLEQAFRYALELADDQAVFALQKLQAQLQTQERALVQIQKNIPEQAATVMQLIRQTIQERLQWVETGLSDPNLLREQLRTRHLQPDQGNGTPNPDAGYGPGDGTPDPGAGYGPGDGVPNDGEGYGPGDGVPNDGEGYGPGDGTPDPGEGYGPGDGIPNDGDGFGPGDGTPDPGAGYGPGEGTPDPGESYGPSDGIPNDGDGFGPGDGTPDPGAGYGPGEGTPACSETPTPGASYGPGDGEPGATETPEPPESYGPGEPTTDPGKN